MLNGRLIRGANKLDSRLSRRASIVWTRPPCSYHSSNLVDIKSDSDSIGLLGSNYQRQCDEFKKEIEALPERRGMENLESFLLSQSSFPGNLEWSHIVPPLPPKGGYKYEMDRSQLLSTLDAALGTFCLHVESRIAALVGKGFYTIGPCGEEMLSSIGVALEDHDDAALHYRHLGVSLNRTLKRRGRSAETMRQILLDRARGYTVSRKDPVTGGVHCSIGNHQGPGRDYLVTSTLASQCSPATGRALGYSLAAAQGVDTKKPKGVKAVSMVTLGDGSVHNHHFWSAFHLARHARHKSIQCPVIFGISNNGISISYSTQDYVKTLFENDPLVKLFQADGNDMVAIYDKTKQAADHSRKRAAPSVVLYNNITRRFGHAASDRQHAYLHADQIQQMADSDVLERGIAQAVETFNACTYAEVKDRFEEIKEATRDAFARASEEEKVKRGDMLHLVAQPMVSIPRLSQAVTEKALSGAMSDTFTEEDKQLSPKVDVMRKHMTRVIEEHMAKDSSIVYLGEDVEHGGYYLVTEQISKKFPGRIIDFPPDETSLLGAAMGFSQVGLTPIVEIPYAKYLDCGADMFYEIAIMNWLSAGKQTNGMLIRLQGFDRGLFGGNFHTHNMLNNIPPGVDVVCYSNGEDYVRGFRNALAQARAGRVVVSVDSTNLLNLRHLHGRDRGWERPYPELANKNSRMMSFHDVIRYGTKGKMAIVTYGSGVVTALQAKKALYEKGVVATEDAVDVIDSPCLSMVPDGLKEAIQQYQGAVFADVCKEGPGSNILSSTIVSLKAEALLPELWVTAFACRTYNPLGSMETFLNVEDVEAACERLLSQLAS